MLWTVMFNEDELNLKGLFMKFGKRLYGAFGLISFLLLIGEVFLHEDITNTLITPTLFLLIVAYIFVGTLREFFHAKNTAPDNPAPL